MDKQKIHFIVNPAAGQGKPILNLINDILNPTHHEWDVSITKEEGDGLRLAKEAVASGANLIAVYGGDGSVREVASGLANSQVPLGIIPGGTGNVMSIELGIPRDTEAAIQLLIDETRRIRTIDMGMASDHGFILRLGIGLEAAIIEGAGRELKDRYGVFAYIMSGILALREPVIANYHMVIDGKEFTYDGMVCIVANAGNLGVPGLFLSPNIDVSDGLLDVFVIRKGDLASILSLTADVLGGRENNENLLHWQAHEVQVTADPPQPIQGDGELFELDPVDVKVLPQALQVIVPSPDQENR